MGFSERYVNHRSKKEPEFKIMWEKRQKYIQNRVKELINQKFSEEEAFKKAYDELDAEDIN